ncbi:MAG: hypothetical protein GXZ13_03540 [Synergistaceae bacterium]|jgi:hypothetical protein|nr:hypothetical protein [Synergistaceae bacterium]
MKVIDAKELTPALSVIKIKEAVDSGEKEFSVLINDKDAVSEIVLYLKKQSFSFSLKEDAGAIHIIAKKTLRDASIYKQMSKKTTPVQPVLLLTSNKIGADSSGLGSQLMNEYFKAIAEEAAPTTLVLMNEAVKMAQNDSPMFNLLKKLEKSGTQILICELSVKHFDCLNKIGIGNLSTITEITKATLSDTKPFILS